jgi:hypothetical protein
MPTFQIRRGDPSASPPPSDDPALTVLLTADDRAVICVGAKMFAASDTGQVSRGMQSALIGKRYAGPYAGTVDRKPLSHGGTLNISIHGVDIPDETAKTLDQMIKDALADLVYRRYLVCTVDGGARLTPDEVRTHA